MGKRFEKEDFEKYKNKVMYGRISYYDKRRGYGFIHTEIGKDIFLSSYDVLDKERKLAAGTTIRFYPFEREGRYVAAEAKIVSNWEYGEKFILPNGKSLIKRDIIKIEYIPGMKFVKNNIFLKEEILERGISFHSLDCVNIITRDYMEYKIFSEDSIISDKHMKVYDLNEYWKKCKREFLYI